MKFRSENNILKQVMDHRIKVSMRMSLIGNDLAARGRRHDNSYSQSTEMDLIKKSFNDETEEKRKHSMELLEGVHASHNDYMVNHFDNGIKDMNILQLVEYITDKMASVDEEVEEPTIEVYEEYVLNGVEDASDDLKSVVKNTIMYILNRNGVVKKMIDRRENEVYGKVEEE